MTELLPVFRQVQVPCGEVTINVRVAGAGSPVLLLHGYPQTHVMWHRVAPMLARHHTVVLADLRGYGDSSKPETGYSKREMANDMVSAMDHLGHRQFAVVGHDRGGRVAHRMALDHPQPVSAIAVLDIVPTLHMFENVDRAMASSYFHWFFLTVANGLPEALIQAAPQAWLDSRFAGRHAGGDAIEPAALAEYARCFDNATIHASCEDYRAAADIDLMHDRADLATGNIVMAPLLALWGTKSYVGRNFRVLDVWRGYAQQVSGAGIAADHYLAEEASGAVLDQLLPFLASVHIPGAPR